MMNVLLSSAGRRSYLVNYFKSAVGQNGKVIVCNSIAGTPAMISADKSYLVPFVYEPGYIDALLDICKKEDINYLFSLHDLDGPILAKNKKQFEDIGVFLFVPDYDFVDVCIDKYKTFSFLTQNRFNTPKTWINPEEVLNSEVAVNFPLIVKPRYGFGSIDILKVRDYEELKFVFNYFEKRKNEKILNYLGHDIAESSTIIQQIVVGQEYGLGVVNTSQKEFSGALTLRKEAMRSGETDVATIIKDDRLNNLAENLSQVTRHVGLLDIDVFMTENSLSIIELNPRFGGQYPFAHSAGANIPAYLIGVEPQICLPTPNKRFYKDIVLKHD